MKATAVFVYVCAAAIGLATILGAAIVDEPLWARVFVGLVGLVMCPFLILLGRAYSKAAQPTAAPLSPQQVMRNTHEALPAEYREWFEWTAELAGFEDVLGPYGPYRVKPEPARRAGPVLIDHSVTRVDYAQALIASRLYAQPKNHPKIEIQDGQVVDNPDGGIRPYGICSYAPGVGWEEDWIDGHHVWIRRQP